MTITLVFCSCHLPRKIASRGRKLVVFGKIPDDVSDWYVETLTYGSRSDLDDAPTSKKQEVTISGLEVDVTRIQEFSTGSVGTDLLDWCPSKYKSVATCLRRDAHQIGRASCRERV